MTIYLHNLLVSSGQGVSSSMRRMIFQGAIRVDGHVVRDPAYVLRPGAHDIQIGHHRRITVVIGESGDAYRVE